MTNTDVNYEEMLKQMQEAKASQVINRTINANPTPETPIDVAHLIIQNSKTAELLAEIDKELKLANLDSIEKYQVYKFIITYQDMLWMRREQLKKELEFKTQNGELIDKYPHFFEDEDVLSRIEEQLDADDEMSAVFDKAGLLRMGIFVPALTRGKFGFERTKQVETISRASIETSDRTEKKPGFLGGMFGGFKK